MKARKVKGLDPAAPLVDNARKIVATRVDELYSFDPHGDSDELHNMRIAAKRLRYVLELTAPALGDGAARGARQAKEIQTLLGDLYDCDEMLVLLSGERGLDPIVAHFSARRDRLHARFIRKWERLERDGFRGQLEQALQGRYG